MMATNYLPFKIALSDGQKKKLQKAFAPKSAVTLRVKPERIGRGDELLLTGPQINKMKKVASERRGADLKMSKTQIEKTAQWGGSIFSSQFSLARPLIKPVVKALASAGLSFGAEKALKKIFGNGYGPNEIKLYKLVQKMTPDQKKAVEKYLVGRGMVSGRGRYGGFLGMLASIGVPIAIDLISKMFGKGMQGKPPPRSRRSTPSKRGRGMHVRPPPFLGTWDDLKKKKVRFKDVPLSNFDLRDWCRFLNIPIKGIFSRNEDKPLHHSPCIINLDDFGSIGIHWVCCWKAKNGDHEYFDSFGLPPPDEWEQEWKRMDKMGFHRNDNQLQWFKSVRCGYYCLLFLNERNRGTSFKNILNTFSSDVLENERIVKNYFS